MNSSKRSEFSGIDLSSEWQAWSKKPGSDAVLWYLGKAIAGRLRADSTRAVDSGGREGRSCTFITLLQSWRVRRAKS
eukprot:5874228-Amphidinium_carterae.1